MTINTHSDEIRHHLFGKIYITKDNSDYDDNEYGDKTDDDDDGWGGDDGVDDADKNHADNDDDDDDKNDDKNNDDDDDDERGAMRKLGKTRFAEGGRRDEVLLPSLSWSSWTWWQTRNQDKCWVFLHFNVSPLKL